MPTRFNEFDQPIGAALPAWSPRPRPAALYLHGEHCRIEALDAARHADELYAAYRSAADGRDWTYLPVGPFEDAEAFRRHIDAAARSADPLHHAVIDRARGTAVGTLALMRIDCANGVIEVGHVTFSPLLQGRTAATEAQYLLMKHVFDTLGYRRYEWKCDRLNAPSRAAALRLGFSFEGLFRQAVIYKGRSRDTAWYSILDHEWPALEQAFLAWLAPANFDAGGRQLRSLAELRAAATT